VGHAWNERKADRPLGPVQTAVSIARGHSPPRAQMSGSGRHQRLIVAISKRRNMRDGGLLLSGEMSGV